MEPTVVNRHTVGIQLNPTLAALPNGFIVAWQGCLNDSVSCEDPFLGYDEGCGVFSQSFNLQGQKTWGKCNDGICGESESCVSCPKDCGSCG